MVYDWRLGPTIPLRLQKQNQGFMREPLMRAIKSENSQAEIVDMLTRPCAL